MTPEQRAAMEKALEALDWCVAEINRNSPASVNADKAITALTAALADDALNKMAENAREIGLDYEPVIDKSAAIRIATALGWEPKREWVGLTESEIIMCSSISVLRFYDAIEAKLREKNT